MAMPKFKDERLTALVIIVVLLVNMFLTLAGHVGLTQQVTLAAQAAATQAAAQVSMDCVQALQAIAVPR
jgi:hypothetical protein